MIIAPGRALAFPSGRTPKIPAGHPWNIPGSLRYSAVARADGSILEQRSGAIIGPAGAGGMAGALTPMGPGVVATVQSASGLYKIPVVVPSEVIQTAFMAVIFTAMTANSGQGIVNVDFSGGTTKINIQAAGAGVSINTSGVNVGLTFNPLVPGHTYLYMGSFKMNGSNTNRYNAACVDLTTGQIEYVLGGGGAGTAPATSATFYGCYTYSTGTNERNILHAGLLAINGVGTPAPYDMLAAVQRGNPFDFWYEPAAPSIQTAAQFAPPAPTPPAPSNEVVMASAPSPLPWRKITPLHAALGERSMRIKWTQGVGAPLAASPFILQFAYSAPPMDRIVGFAFEIAKGGTPCDVIVKELNTGWFIDVTYDGTTGISLAVPVETLVDSVNLVLYFSVAPGVDATASFLNSEVAPYKAAK